MVIGSTTTARPANAGSEHQATLVTRQRKQEEAVVGKLLQGVQENPAPAGKGKLLNVSA